VQLGNKPASDKAYSDFRHRRAPSGKVHLTAYGLARKLCAEPFGYARDGSFASRRRRAIRSIA